MADTQNFYWSPFKKLHEILIKPSHNLGGCNILKHWTWSRNWTEAVKGETANKFGNLFWTTWHWDPSAAASPKFLDLSLHTNWFAVLPPLGKTLISVQHNFCQTTGGVDSKHRLVLIMMWILMTMSTIKCVITNLWNLTLAMALFAADSWAAGFRAERVTRPAMAE